MSRFIHSLRSDVLKKDLYLKKCVPLDEVTKEAIDMVDNYKFFEDESEKGNDKKSSTSSETSSTKTKKVKALVTYEQLTEELLRQVNA